MSSWRDDPDPDCPECGGPISPTSQYCMHCGAEFDDPDGAVGVTHTDDAYEEDPGRTEDGLLAALVARLRRWQRDDGTARPRDHRRVRNRDETDRTRDASADKRTHSPDRDTEQSEPEESRRGDGSMPTESAFEKAPLWMRGLTAFLVSIPVALVGSLVLIVLVQSFAGLISALLLPAVWITTFAYLVRKPLPSDIVGDAFYALAGLLLVGPVLGYALMIGRAQVTTATLDDSLGELVVELLLVEFGLIWPAAFLAGLGYVGNWWAARRLRGSAEPRSDRG